MNFSPLCIDTAYFQWIRCPEFRVVGGLGGALFILGECQTLIWTPQNSRRRPRRPPTRTKNPKGLADISNIVADPRRAEVNMLRQLP